MFHTMLVPLDGSSLAEEALPHVTALGSAFGADVHLLRVIPVRQRGGAAPLDIIDRRLGRAEAAAYLDAVATDLRTRGLHVETDVREGRPAEQILDVLRRLEADLLVLTTHGAGGCSEFPLSGTASKLVSRAGVSVVLVPTAEPTGAGRGAAAGYRRILVGLDGSRRGRWALGAAEAIARAAGADVVLAHVVQVPETVEDSSSELREAARRLVALNQAAAQEHLSAARVRLESGGLRALTRVEASPAIPEALAALAETEEADLVALTAHGTINGPRPYGATAMQLLAHVPRPLLIAQDAPRPRTTRRIAQARQTTLNHR